MGLKTAPFDWMIQRKQQRLPRHFLNSFTCPSLPDCNTCKKGKLDCLMWIWFKCESPTPQHTSSSSQSCCHFLMIKFSVCRCGDTSLWGGRGEVQVAAHLSNQWCHQVNCGYGGSLNHLDQTFIHSFIHSYVMIRAKLCRFQGAIHPLWAAMKNRVNREAAGWSAILHYNKDSLEFTGCGGI